MISLLLNTRSLSFFGDSNFVILALSYSVDIQNISLSHLIKESSFLTSHFQSLALYHILRSGKSKENTLANKGVLLNYDSILYNLSFSKENLQLKEISFQEVMDHIHTLFQPNLVFPALIYPIYANLSYSLGNLSPPYSYCLSYFPKILILHSKIEETPSSSWPLPQRPQIWTTEWSNLNLKLRY